MSKRSMIAVELDSDWNDHNLAPFTSRSNEPWSVRWQELQDEIALRETDLEDMNRTMPHDRPGLADLKAYIASLHLAKNQLMNESGPRRTAGKSGIHILTPR